jgi:hypothetical protein
MERRLGKAGGVYDSRMYPQFADLGSFPLIVGHLPNEETSAKDSQPHGKAGSSAVAPGLN